MTYELRLERLYDAPPEVVFDAFTDPANQAELHGEGTEGWAIQRAETDVRVGGTSTYAMGPEGVEPDVETRVFTVVDRPHRLEFRHSMKVAEWGGRTVETDMTLTFEDQDGKTLLTMVQTGFEREAGPRRLHGRLAHLPRHAQGCRGQAAGREPEGTARRRRLRRQP